MLLSLSLSLSLSKLHLQDERSLLEFNDFQIIPFY